MLYTELVATDAFPSEEDRCLPNEGRFGLACLRAVAAAVGDASASSSTLAFSITSNATEL
jgi:hypothetical protein